MKNEPDVKYRHSFIGSFNRGQCKTVEEQEQVVARVERLIALLMQFAEQNLQQPIAMNALVQMVVQEFWVED